MIKKEQSTIDQAICNYLSKNILDSDFQEAAKYITNGGKRYRALIGLKVYHALGGPYNKFIKSAVGVELTHAASLVFDDLPVMDNSPLRKGKPTIHTIYNEPTALLTGLYLWDQGRQAILENICEHTTNPKDIASICSIVTHYFTDLIHGQELDLKSESCRTMEYTLKKTNLFQLVCVLPAYLLNKTEYLDQLEEAGKELSLAYQMFDDLRDTIGTVELTGKPVQSDSHNSVIEYGINKIKDKLEESKLRIIEIFREIGNYEELENLINKIFSTLA